MVVSLVIREPEPWFLHIPRILDRGMRDMPASQTVQLRVSTRQAEDGAHGATPRSGVFFRAYLEADEAAKHVHELVIETGTVEWFHLLVRHPIFVLKDWLKIIERCEQQRPNLPYLDLNVGYASLVEEMATSQSSRNSRLKSSRIGNHVDHEYQVVRWALTCP
jgi:hypothetical protein